MNKYQKIARQIAKYIALDMAIKYNYTGLPTNGRVVYSDIKKWPLEKILAYKEYNLKCLNETVEEDLQRIKKYRHYY